MGLDICVFKPVKLKKLDPENDNRIVLEPSMDQHDELREAFKDFIVEQDLEFYDEDEALVREGLNPQEHELVGMNFGKTTVFTFTPIGEEKIIEISDIPLIKRRVAVIYHEEVGYQRKGANPEFYSDGMWDSPPVLKLKDLEEHYRKYFSESDGFGHDFKKNIIDKFVEGETYVEYC